MKKEIKSALTRTITRFTSEGLMLVSVGGFIGAFFDNKANTLFCFVVSCLFFGLSVLIGAIHLIISERSKK